MIPVGVFSSMAGDGAEDFDLRCASSSNHLIAPQAPLSHIAELERENAELRAAIVQYGQRPIGPMTEDELVAFRDRLSASWEHLGDVAAPEAKPFPAQALRPRVGQRIGMIEP